MQDFEHSITPRRLTSVFSAPTHTPWASLLSHLQRYEPLLFLEQGPFISVKRWNPGMSHQESDYWQGTLPNTLSTQSLMKIITMFADFRRC